MFLFVLLLAQPNPTKADACDIAHWTTLASRIVLDGVPVVGGTLNRLLDAILPSDCYFDHIKALIQSYIDENNQRRLRLHIKGLNNTWSQMLHLGHDRIMSNMWAFYYDLNNLQPQFAETDLLDAIVYFRDFGNAKIAVMNSLVNLETNDEKKIKLNGTFQNQILKLIDEGETLIKEVPKSMWNRNKQKCTHSHWGISSQRKIIRNLLVDTLNIWRQRIDNNVGGRLYIYDWEMIGLQLPGGKWVSCWVSGSKCKPRTCPGAKGEALNGCRGERFAIVNDRNTYIKNCETIALRYSYQNNKGYWLSWYKMKGNLDTKSCPGKSFNGLQNSNSGCGAEKWTINTPGKECGKPIEHMDLITLKRPGYGYYLTSIEKHIIFGYYSRSITVKGRSKCGWSSWSPPSLVIVKPGLKYESDYYI